MISYRKFFSICLMMAVLFFMFQFLQLYKEMGNEYSTNQYMEGERLSGEGRWQAKEGEGEYVLFVGKGRKRRSESGLPMVFVHEAQAYSVPST